MLPHSQGCSYLGLGLSNRTTGTMGHDRITYATLTVSQTSCLGLIHKSTWRNSRTERCADYEEMLYARAKANSVLLCSSELSTCQILFGWR
ncbi:hypothetical protein BDZ89DRAFT_12774 [Hymenopellis radicata]|nr:hypothetical protein BDZ89DRAFT_12774 [Hymenopellis radicata]